jgi:hypothetical protein
MAFESLLHEIDTEISRLQQAKTLLSGTNGHRSPGRPTKAAASAKTVTPVKASSPKRVLSAKAREGDSRGSEETLGEDSGSDDEACSRLI